MKFCKTVTLKNGKECLLRSAEPEDAQAYQEYFAKSHAETSFLTTYPDESSRSPEKTAQRLIEARDSETNIELCAFVDGILVGSAGNDMLRERDKMRHRAGYGISILKEYWGLGIGSILTETCIELAREAGFLQLELDVVDDNVNAIRLYEKYGFVEYGRNPRGFRTREGEWQELVCMRLELD